MAKSVIHAGPIWSKLTADADVKSLVDSTLSFDVKAAKFNARLKMLIRMKKWDGKQHLFNKKLNIFPTGLLSLVAEKSNAEIQDSRFSNENLDVCIQRAKSLSLNGISLSEDQRNAIVAAITAKRGRMEMGTNSGKSEVIIGISEAMQKKSLWIVHRKDLLRQCADRYKLRTGKDASKWGDGVFEDGGLMTIGMVQSIDTKSHEGRAFLKQFDILFIDECVHAQSDTWYALAMNCPAPYRFGLTGAMPEDPLKNYKIRAVTDDALIYKTTNKEMIESGWSAKPTVHLQQLDYEENNWTYKYAYDQMIRFNTHYASIIAEETNRWYEQGKTVLIIVDRMAQGDKINRELNGRNVPCQFMHGQQEGQFRHVILEKFRNGKLPVVIATSIFDEGIDVPAIQTLILAAGGKSIPRQLQRIGRALRRKQGANVVDIVDYIHNGNYYLLRHGLERVDLYEKEGFELKWRSAIHVRNNNARI